MSSSWDDAKPNLAKLPPQLKQNLTQPIPVRPEEVYGGIHIFKKTQGLHHPNGRILVSKYYKDAGEESKPTDALQIDFSDFTGRTAVGTLVLKKTQAQVILTSMMRTFLQIGGSVAELESALQAATNQLQTSVAKPYTYEDPK
jgi:hypothetical protein